MANNCINFININGSVNEIQEFSKLLEIGEKQENGYDIYANLCSEFGKSENDGRWFDITVVDKDENCIVISGDSAWSPCLGLFTEISEKYQSFIIRYEYDEMGCDFAGFAEISQGNCNNNCFSYWKGMIAIQGESDAMEMVINNELDCYETKEELIESDMYNAFSKENQKEILENYNV